MTVLVAGVVLASCSKPAPLEVTSTLSPTDKGMVLPVADPAIHAAAQDYRPAIAPPRWVPNRPVGTPVPLEGKLRQVYRVGPAFKDAQLFVTRAWKPKAEQRWRHLAPVLARSRGDQLVVSFEMDDPTESDLYIEAFKVPPAEQTFTSDPVTVQRGSVLAGGYALGAAARGVSDADVVFRIVARDGENEHQVFAERRRTSEAKDHAWSDYRIDLSSFAGKTVTFDFVTRVEPRPDADASATATPNVALPLWSTPRVLQPRPESKLRNVVLISLDTLRADYVGAYGKHADTTPNIDRLAAQGVLFENAYTTYPSTTASHMSMLTGVYPSVHGLYAPGKILPPHIRTAAEIFDGAGYQTVAVTENGMLAGAAGFRRGFGFYREFKDEKALSDGHVGDVVSSAIAWLEQHRDERFFMFLHTYQVHDPYDPPPAFDVFKTYEENGRVLTVDDATPPMVRNRLRYAGDVLYTDSEVGRFLERLDDLFSGSDTVVVITSDHGEALGEHGLIGHGWFTLDPVLHVPLVIRASGIVPAGLRVATPVSLVDVTPTMLALAGVESQVPMQGADLVELLSLTERQASRPEDRTVYVETMRATKVEPIARTRTAKWISSPNGIQRFDMIADPEENSPQSDASVIAAGERLFEAYRRDNDETRRILGDPTAAPQPIDPLTEEKLRALGYSD